MDERVTRRATLTAMAGISPLLVRADRNAFGATLADGPKGVAAPPGQTRESIRPLADRVDELAISIVDHGAVGDGDPAHAAINTAAIRAAIARSATRAPRSAGTFARMPEIFVPAGVFVVDERVFELATPSLGMRFRGTGWFSSILQLSPQRGLGDRWMFDNAGGGRGAGERLAFPMFTDLGFEGRAEVPGPGAAVAAGPNFMRIEAHDVAQGFRFERCVFHGFDTCFHLAGTNLASENKFIDCKVFHCNTVVALANQQSFNTDFIGTEIEDIYRSVFHFLPSPVGVSGGAIRVSHASFLPTGDCAIVRTEAGMSTQGVVIRDSRIEMRGRSRYFQGMGEVSYGELTIVDCGILNTESSGVRRIAEIGTGQCLRFVRCLFNTLGQDERFGFLPQRNHYMTGPRLIWEDCQLPCDMASRIEMRPGNHAAQASARNCRTNEGQANDPGAIHAADFDLFGRGDADGGDPFAPSQGGDAQLRRKSVALKLGNAAWPRADGRGGAAAETRLMLPPFARILRIVLAKPSGGRIEAPYALRVRTESGAVLLDTPTVAQNAALFARYDPEAQDRMPFACGEALPSRTIVLTLGPATHADAGEYRQQGYAYLEYL